MSLVVVLYGILMYGLGILTYEWGFRAGRRSAFEDRNGLEPRPVPVRPEADPEASARLKQAKAIEKLARELETSDE